MNPIAAIESKIAGGIGGSLVSSIVDPVPTREQDRLISDAIESAGPRLRSFIRRRVADHADAEDILQDVFYELIESYRMMKPIEQVSAWLYRVARNRITDLFRKRPTTSLSEPADVATDGDSLLLEEVLPSAEAGPEAAYARTMMLDAIEEALEELPPEQSEVFVAHEFLGTSFKELAAETGVSVNTLLARKRYAVLHLRKRLRTMYEELSA